MKRTDVRSEERYESIIFSNRADSIKRGQALPFPRKSGEGVRPLRFLEEVVKGSGPSVTGKSVSGLF